MISIARQGSWAACDPTLRHLLWQSPIQKEGWGGITLSIRINSYYFSCSLQLQICPLEIAAQNWHPSNSQKLPKQALCPTKEITSANLPPPALKSLNHSPHSSDDLSATNPQHFNQFVSFWPWSVLHFTFLILGIRLKKSLLTSDTAWIIFSLKSLKAYVSQFTSFFTNERLTECVAVSVIVTSLPRGCGSS